jgi:tetratricopeptide (TPR) repeat protein
MKNYYLYNSKSKKIKSTSLLIILIFLTHIVLSQNGEILFNTAFEKYEAGDFKGAIENYTKCIALEPTLAEAYHNRAMAKTNLKDFKGAILDHDKAISIDSTKADYFYNRGRAKYFFNDLMGCLIDNSIVIEMNPNFGLAYLNRGLVRVKIGNKKVGCEDLMKAKELNVANMQGILDEYCK